MIKTIGRMIFVSLLAGVFACEDSSSGAGTSALPEAGPIDVDSGAAPKPVADAGIDAPVEADAAPPAFDFFTDFETGVPSAIEPGTGQITGTQGFATLGPTGKTFGPSFLRSETANVVKVTLSGLPPHANVSLGFLFAAIDSLDGTGTFPAGDFLKITVDGAVVFRESFANATDSQVQSYVPPAGGELARRVDLGFQGPAGYYTDSAYDMSLEPKLQKIPHSASTLTIEFTIEGEGTQSLDDESWAIDNVHVTTGS